MLTTEGLLGVARRPAVDELERPLDLSRRLLRELLQRQRQRQGPVMSILAVEQGEDLRRHGRFVAAFGRDVAAGAVEDFQQWVGQRAITKRIKGAPVPLT